MTEGRDIERVLVVDDEHDIRTVARMALTTLAGWITVMAADGAEALERFAEQRFDVVLLDVMMPGMDGIETLVEIRSRDPKVPVIMVTAKAQRHEIHSYFEAGAAGVITKPFDPMTLAARVRDLVGTARQRSERAGALTSRIEQLRVGYVSRLPEKMKELDQAFSALKQEDSADTRRALRTLAHKLHGTGGSYGLADLSTAAGALEKDLLDESDLKTVEAQLEALRSLMGDLH